MDPTRPGCRGWGDRGALVGITVVVLLTALLAWAPIEIPIIDD
jgi:hypothetical protein